MKSKSSLRGATPQRRATTLPRAQACYREVVEDLTEVISRFKADGTLLFVNEVYCRFFGKSRQSLLGNKWHPQAVVEDVPKIEALLRTLSPANPVVIIENRVHSGSGEVRWMQFVNRAFFDAAGRLTETQSVGRDITEQKRLSETLRLSEARYRSLVASSMDAVLLTAPEGRILSANEAACRMFGRTEPELIAMGRSGVVDTSDPRLAPALEARARTGRFQGELTLVRQDGTRFEAEVSSVVFTDDAGQPRTSRGIRDVTERKRVEEELRKLTRAVEQSSAIVIITDLDGRIEYVNPKTCERTGYTADELIGRNVRLFKSGHTSAEEYRRLWQTITSGRDWDGEFLNRKKNGSLYWERATISPIKDEAGRITHFVAIKEDITERKWAEGALQDLSGRLLQLQDEERRRLARELHDTTAQSLAAVAMHLNVANAGRAKLNERERKSLAEALALAGQCVQEIRTLSHLLHPPMLDDLGLAGAVRDYVDGFAGRSGIRVDLELAADLGRLPRAMELALFRVLQEALTNVHRHSGSRTASIRLLRIPGEVRLDVRDAGRGMEKPVKKGEQVATPPRLGVGIAGMRDRLRQLGGRLEIDSDGAGTTISAILTSVSENDI